MWLIITIIFVALIFDYINGFHDAANSVATIVATKVMKPIYAVGWAAFFNFVAAFAGSTGVAHTIGKGVIDVKKLPHHAIPYFILAALVGAIIWNLITWILGLPTSSSHALIGGLVGSAIAMTASTKALMLPGLEKIVLFIFLAPAIGLILGLTIMTLVAWICRKTRPGRVDKTFRFLQFFSAGAYSFGHGLNDAQKTMGIIWMLLLFLNPVKYAALPLWVILICHAAIAAGTMSGGWRIVKTMGSKITKLQPPGGFSAESAAAITLIWLSMKLKMPVSTTHTITGAIVGVGSTRRLSAVRWGVAGRIVWAWILTIPMAAAVGALSYLMMKPLIH